METVAAVGIVSGEGVSAPSVVELDGDAIAAVRPLDPAAVPAGDVADVLVAPGFVDLQVNGIDDIDVATAAGDAWNDLDRLLLAQGVTAWCPTLVTAPLDSYAAKLDRIAEAAARPPAGRPAILGAHLEGPFLGGAPGAHRREHLSPIDLDWLAALPEIVRVVTLAPELPGALDAIRLLCDKGVLVSIGHSTATFEQAEAAIDAGARLATHLFNGMGPLHHRDPGIVGAVLADERVTASVICDLVHLHPAVVRAAFRVKGWGRVALVTDAVAWMDADGSGARTGYALDDGAPRLPDGTLAGSALTMDAAIRHATDVAGVDLAQAVAAASSTPAAVAGEKRRGRVEAGARADLVTMTARLEVDTVWVGGEAVWRRTAS